MSKKRLDKFAARDGGKVPADLREYKGVSTDSLHPVFSFSFTDPNNWTLAKWQNTELSDLVECFQTMEKLEWGQVRTNPALRWTLVQAPPPHSHVVLLPDDKIHEVCSGGPKRLVGVRRGQLFCVMWFDRDHTVCPEHKNR